MASQVLFTGSTPADAAAFLATHQSPIVGTIVQHVDTKSPSPNDFTNSLDVVLGSLRDGTDPIANAVLASSIGNVPPEGDDSPANFFNLEGLQCGFRNLPAIVATEVDWTTFSALDCSAFGSDHAAAYSATRVGLVGCTGVWNAGPKSFDVAVELATVPHIESTSTAAADFAATYEIHLIGWLVQEQSFGD